MWTNRDYLGPNRLASTPPDTPASPTGDTLKSDSEDKAMSPAPRHIVKFRFRGLPLRMKTKAKTPIEDERADPADDERADPADDERTDTSEDERTHTIEDERADSLEDQHAGPIQDERTERHATEERFAPCSELVRDLLQKYANAPEVLFHFWNWHENAAKYEVPDWFTWEEVYLEREDMVKEALEKDIDSLSWDQMDLPQVRLMRKFSQHVYEMHQRGLPKLPHDYTSIIDKILSPDNIRSEKWKNCAVRYKRLVNHGLDYGCLWHTGFKNQANLGKYRMTLAKFSNTSEIPACDLRTDNLVLGVETAKDWLVPSDEESVKDTVFSAGQRRSFDAADARSLSPKSVRRGSLIEEEPTLQLLHESSLADPPRPSASPVRRAKNTEARAAPYARSLSPKKSSRSDSAERRLSFASIPEISSGIRRGRGRSKKTDAGPLSHTSFGCTKKSDGPILRSMTRANKDKDSA